MTLFLVDFFLVHLLLTLQLVMKNAQMSLAKVFFRTFLQIKKSAKVASRSGSELLLESSPSTPAAQLEGSVDWVRLRERHAGKTFLWNRVLTVQSGGLQLVSRSCGTAKGMRRERCTTGTGTRVPPRLSSLLFLLGEERYRQPRAVYKYWAPCRLCWEDTYAVGWFLSTAPPIWQSLVRCSPWLDSGYMLRQSTAAFVGDC